MSSLSGVYFDGRSARGKRVEVSRFGEQLVLDDGQRRLSFPVAEATVTARLGTTRRRITLRDGAMCEVDDDALLDHWFSDAANRRWNLLARLEAHRAVVALACLAVVSATAASVLWGLPLLARHVAAQVPEEWVLRLGQDALAQLDEMLGAETTLTESRRAGLELAFARLAAESVPHARLAFRTWPRLGPNALALPDGTVVMTDGLVYLAEQDDELLAILAHELGHVRERHALQRIIASSGVAALLYAMTGDVSGLAASALAAPTILLHLHHTRSLEEDADRFAFALLREHGIAPSAFATILRKLEGASEVAELEERPSRWSWLSTHPPTAERARQAELFGSTN